MPSVDNINITVSLFILFLCSFFNVIFPHSSKSTIILQYIWVGMDTGGVKVPHSQRL